MRKRIWIPCIVAVAICLIFLIKRRQSPQIPTVSQAQSLVNVTQSSIQPKTVENPPNANVLIYSNTPTSTPRSSGTYESYSNTIYQQQLAAWQAPIEFYGKVIDENSNSLSGAKISFRWVEKPTAEGNRTSSTESDSEGLFSLRGARGPGLTVIVNKEGYYISRSTPDSFRYALGSETFHPDLSNPIIFHLRKKGMGESLIGSNFPGFAHIAQLHHDGTPVELDLLKGTQVSAGTGQLKLEFWRDVSHLNVQPFDWKLQLSTPGGGLIQTDEEFAFEAPEKGYQPSIVLDMPATNQNWQGEITSKYYIRLSDGKYGRIDFYLLPRNGAFTVQSVFNLSGSRNLEPK